MNTNQAEQPKTAAQSPTDVMKILNEATKNSDTATMKTLVSKGTLTLLEESAKEQNTTVDELLKADEGSPFEELPEMRNEKVEGDKATIEIKNKLNGEFTTVPFVKEDGSWKIALDAYLKELQERAVKDLGKAPANTKSAPANKK